MRHRKVYLSDASPSESGSDRVFLDRKQFGARLLNELVDRGWSQSDLGRAAGVSRDSISRYVTGKNLPDLPQLKRIAEALDMEPADLLPNFDLQAIKEDMSPPAFEMKAIADNPGRSMLRINREVPTALAFKIGTLLEEGMASESAPTRKRG